MEKLIITIAPTGNVPTREMTPHVPVTPEEIARDIMDCYRAGAAVAHIHARDENQKPTHKVEFFAEILRRLDELGCPVIRQLSTGGRHGRTLEERSANLQLNPEMASLCTGSTNFPNMAYVNPPDLVEHLARIMLERNIKPEIEVFDTAMINNAVLLKEAGLLREPLHFNFVLGIRGALPATPKNLFHLVESLPPGSTWTVTVIGPQHVYLSTIALAMGGHVRVGIEDNIYYQKGVLAKNVQLVERIVRIARAVGRDIATPDEARRILGLKGNS
ncbi:3-keto-5-aminohexanoate cleavage protein [Desulfovirgula thermocuniculi]|uniref:3-keto-5-aminohexanoate cleavage protein n=1 Tax=Desulfovirgula thermocuniculi TaxID=348842 RepID=UPI0003F93DAD|nr:3-keto-5-aminohexanoate cleavage protein [Desulfovirgula thermocuniculi]